MRLAVDIEVRREPRDAGLVWQERIAAEVGPGLQIVGMRPLPHAPDGPPRETGADFRDRPQGRRRDELDLGCAVDVDELDQQVGDPVILKSALELDKLFFQVGHAYAGPFLGRCRLAAWQIALASVHRRFSTLDCWQNDSSKPIKLRAVPPEICKGWGSDMCGIVAFWDKSGGQEAATGQVVLTMLEALACRGPDSAGIALIGPEPEPEMAGSLADPDHSGRRQRCSTG